MLEDQQAVADEDGVPGGDLARVRILPTGTGAALDGQTVSTQGNAGVGISGEGQGGQGAALGNKHGTLGNVEDSAVGGEHVPQGVFLALSRRRFRGGGCVCSAFGTASVLAACVPAGAAFLARGRGRAALLHPGSGEYLVAGAGVAALGGFEHGKVNGAVQIGDQAVGIGVENTVLGELYKAFHLRFQLGPAGQELFVLGGVAGVLQGQKGGTGIDFLVLLDGKGGDGAVGTGDAEHAVDIQLALPQKAAVCVGDGDDVVHGGCFVGEGDGGARFRQAVHSALQRRPVGQGDGDGLAHGKGSIQVYGHEPVQGQQHQRAVFIHGVGNRGVHLGVDFFDTPGASGTDTGGIGLARVGGNVAVQLVQNLLQLGDGGEHRRLVHLGNGVPGLDMVPVGDIAGLDLQCLGDGQGLALLGGQGAAAGEHGGDGVLLHGIGIDFRVYRGGAGNAGGQGADQQGNGQNNAQKCNPFGPAAAPVRGVFLLRVQRGHGIFRVLCGNFFLKNHGLPP